MRGTCDVSCGDTCHEGAPVMRDTCHEGASVMSHVGIYLIITCFVVSYPEPIFISPVFLLSSLHLRSQLVWWTWNFRPLCLLLTTQSDRSPDATLCQGNMEQITHICNCIINIYIHQYIRQVYNAGK